MIGFLGTVIASMKVFQIVPLLKYVIKSSSDVLPNSHKRKIIFKTITIVFHVVLQGDPS